MTSTTKTSTTTASAKIAALEAQLKEVESQYLQLLSHHQGGAAAHDRHARQFLEIKRIELKQDVELLHVLHQLEASEQQWRELHQERFGSRAASASSPDSSSTTSLSPPETRANASMFEMETRLLQQRMDFLKEQVNVLRFDKDINLLEKQLLHVEEEMASQIASPPEMALLRTRRSSFNKRLSELKQMRAVVTRKTQGSNRMDFKNSSMDNLHQPLKASATSFTSISRSSTSSMKLVPPPLPPSDYGESHAGSLHPRGRRDDQVHDDVEATTQAGIQACERQLLSMMGFPTDPQGRATSGGGPTGYQIAIGMSSLGNKAKSTPSPLLSPWSSLTPSVTGSLVPRPLPSKPTTQWMGDLYRELTQHAPDLEPMACWNLPQAFQQLFGLKPKLLVRNCFGKLVQLACCIAQTHHLMVLGPQGIGKTCWGLLLVGHLVVAGNTVLYETQVTRDNQEATSCCLLLSPYRVATGHRREFENVLGDPEAFYVADDATFTSHHRIAAKTIVLARNEQRVCDQLLYWVGARAWDVRYLPVWTREEMQHARVLLYPEAEQSDSQLPGPTNPDEAKKHSAELVNGLFDRWGGVPLFVLAQATNAAFQRQLKHAIDALDLDALCAQVRPRGTSSTFMSMRVNGAQSFNGVVVRAPPPPPLPAVPASAQGGSARALKHLTLDMSSTGLVLHLILNDAFQPIAFKFASEYVTWQVYARIHGPMKQLSATSTTSSHASTNHRFAQFMRNCKDCSEMAQLRQGLFICHAHARLSAGGKFTIRELFRKMPPPGFPRGVNRNNMPAQSFSPTELTLRPLPNMVFEKLEGKSFPTDVYCRARINANDHYSIDAVLKPNLIFRVANCNHINASSTSSNSNANNASGGSSDKVGHCRQKTLHEVLNALGNPMNPSLFFVVLSDQLHQIKFQWYVNSRGKEKLHSDFANVGRVRQFALAIPLE